MSHKEFGPNDIFINRVKMHPEWDFFIYNSEVYINNSLNISGSFKDTYKGVPPGFVSLYEFNIDRTGDIVRPFVAKNSNYKTRFKKDLKNMTGERKAGSTPWGALDSAANIASAYQMSASITRQFMQIDTSTLTNLNHTSSVLKNKCLQYQTINPLFTTRNSNLDQMFSDSVNMINIPSIFYGSEIKKGTLTLNYYITGTLISTAKDENNNGQLICTFGPSGVSGSVVGHALYREGILFFPNAYGASKARIDTGPAGITYNGAASDAKWIHFGHGANEKNDAGASVSPHTSHASASYSINFEGTTYKNTMTMFCHADKGELNYSNNPTFVNTLHSGSIIGYTSGSYTYSDNEVEIKNIASSSFHLGEDEFRRTTYISKVGVYDEDNNLLMTVDLARPYKKEEKDNFTFKIKYDLL